MMFAVGLRDRLPRSALRVRGPGLWNSPAAFHCCGNLSRFPAIDHRSDGHLLRPQQLRHFTAASDVSAAQETSSASVTTRGKAIYRSGKQDVFFNLSVENYLLNNMPSGVTDLLFLWQNSPAVVIGRHQNPWVECKLAELENDQVQICRRHSGGGAVYHDANCLIFSFITPEKDHPRNYGILTRALARCGIVDVQQSGRNDLILSDGRKISGSAFKQVK